MSRYQLRKCSRAASIKHIQEGTSTGLAGPLPSPLTLFDVEAEERKKFGSPVGKGIVGRVGAKHVEGTKGFRRVEWEGARELLGSIERAADRSTACNKLSI